jgi:cobalt-zinc-cadmium efflux system outer membrane protein
MPCADATGHVFRRSFSPMPPAHHRLPGRSPAVRGLIAILLPIAMSGCRTYEPAPLDLSGHGRSVRARLDSLDLIDGFLTEQAARGFEVPARFDPSDGLGLAEAEVLALFHHPELRIVRLDAGITAAGREHAGRWQDPVFGFDAEEVLSGDADSLFGFTVEWTLPVSGRLAVERDRASAVHDAALARIAAAEWRVRAEVRRAWIRWSTARERAELLERFAAESAELDALGGRLSDAGALPRAAARLLRVDRHQRDVERIEAEAAADEARLEILGLLGLAPDAAIELVPSPLPPSPPEPADPESRLIEANPGLAVLRAEHAVAEQQVRLAIRGQYPDLTIGTGYANEGDDRLRLGVSLPVPIFDGNQRAIAEAVAERRRTRATAEAEFERLLLEHDLAHRRLEAAALQEARFTDLILPELREQSEELRQLAEVGELDVLLLLEAVDRRLDAALGRLGLRLRAAEAAIDLAEILGPDAATMPGPDIDREPTTSTRPESIPGADR